MKTLKFLSIVVLSLFLTTALNSCKGEDGADGVDGAQGLQGPAGQDGQDGNANVQTYVYNSPQWRPSGSGMHIDMAGILTDDVIQNDAVLVYVNHPTSIGDRINLIPGLVWNFDYREYAVFLRDSSSDTLETIGIVSLETNGNFTPNANLWDVNWVKVIIIESTNTTTTEGNGKMSPKQQIMNQLANAGVDVNDYQAVCDYYGLDY